MLVFLRSVTFLLFTYNLSKVSSAGLKNNKLTLASWQCKNCRGDEHRKRLLSLIYHSILRSSRMGFLSLDMSWMGNVLSGDSKVVLFVNSAATMGSFSASHLDSSVAPNDDSSGYYNIVVFEKLKSDEPIERMGHLFDSFLVQNPCWVPIHEPALGGGKRSNAVGHNIYAALRLPYIGYGATCRLYTVLTQRQFPSICQYDDTHMSVYQLANIGYGHIIRHAVNGFVAGSMMNNFSIGKVFTMPSSEVYMSRTVSSAEPSSGMPVTVNLGWSWADPATCPHEVFLHNPWACNFLETTNCTNRFLSAHIKPMEAPFWWVTPNNFLHADVADGGAGVSDDFRKQVNEVPWMAEAHWMASRVSAFLQRPNFRLRDELKKTVTAVTNVRELKLDSNVSRSYSSNSNNHRDQGLDLRPCLAMHIRHNDASLDSRSEKQIDRSLVAHVQRSLNVMNMYNISNIFLATDNATVVEVAAQEFPQFNWFVQKRPMSKSVKLYSMFTEAFNSPATEVYVPGHDTLLFHKPEEGKARKDVNISAVPLSQDPVLDSTGSKDKDIKDITTGRRAYSVLSDLAHVLVDIRVASQCSALTGAGDSGMTQLMHASMCVMGKTDRQACPPFTDITKPSQ